MVPQSKLTKAALATASAILATASVAPASADGHPLPPANARHRPRDGQRRDHNGHHPNRRHQRYHDMRNPNRRHRHHFRGRIIAHDGLYVRERPTTHSRIVGWYARGSLVSIRCKVNGESINGNPRWYLMTDGTYAWSSARHIRSLGPAPRWCRSRGEREHGERRRHDDDRGEHD